MTPEAWDTLLKIILIILSGGSGYAVIRGSQREKKREEENRTFKPLYLEATEKLVKQQERIDELELQRDKQAGDIVDIRARLTILNEERAHERRTFQAERDEIMIERGRVSEQLAGMQQKLDKVSAELESIKAENHKLLEYKVRSEKQQLEIDRLAKDLLAEQKTHDLAKRRIEQLENLVDRLSKPDPEPPTPKILPKASGE